MHIAIVTAEGFNELDSFIALGILNRVKRSSWRVSICAPSGHRDVDERRHRARPKPVDRRRLG